MQQYNRKLFYCDESACTFRFSCSFRDRHAAAATNGKVMIIPYTYLRVCVCAKKSHSQARWLSRSRTRPTRFMWDKYSSTCECVGFAFNKCSARCMNTTVGICLQKGEHIHLRPNSDACQSVCSRARSRASTHKLIIFCHMPYLYAVWESHYTINLSSDEGCGSQPAHNLFNPKQMYGRQVCLFVYVVCALLAESMKLSFFYLYNSESPW